jgi:hypothetical protein
MFHNVRLRLYPVPEDAPENYGYDHNEDNVDCTIRPTRSRSTICSNNHSHVTFNLSHLIMLTNTNFHVQLRKSQALIRDSNFGTIWLRESTLRMVRSLECSILLRERSSMTVYESKDVTLGGKGMIGHCDKSEGIHVHGM